MTANIVVAAARILDRTTIFKTLHQYQLPLSFENAYKYLTETLGRLNFLKLYQHYFPVEYAASKASLYPSSIRAEGSGPTLIETEFLELVEARLFPLALEYYLEVWQEGARLNYIPLYEMGLDWWNDNFTDLDLGWQFLLALLGEVDKDSIMDTQHPQLMTALQAIHNSDDLNFKTIWDRLKAECEQAAEPLTYLPQAILMLYHDTGNVFLDPEGENPFEGAEWSIEDFDFLIEDYRQAGELSQQAYQLIEWLQQDPGNFGKVVDLWNKVVLVLEDSQIPSPTALLAQAQT